MSICEDGKRHQSMPRALDNMRVLLIGSDSLQSTSFPSMLRQLCRLPTLVQSTTHTCSRAKTTHGAEGSQFCFIPRGGRKANLEATGFSPFCPLAAGPARVADLACELRLASPFLVTNQAPSIYGPGLRNVACPRRKTRSIWTTLPSIIPTLILRTCDEQGRGAKIQIRPILDA